MDTYIWYAFGAVAIGFLVWWLPRGDGQLATIERDPDDCPFDGGDD